MFAARNKFAKSFGFMPVVATLALLAISLASPLQAQNRGNLNKIRKENLKVLEEIGAGPIVLDEVTELKYDRKLGKMTEYVRTVHLEAGKKYDLVLLVDQTWKSDLILRLIYRPGDIEPLNRPTSNSDGTLEARVETTWFGDTSVKVKRTGDYQLKVWGGPGTYWEDARYWTKRSGFIGVIVAVLNN